MPDLTQDFVARIRDAGLRKSPLFIEGSGSKRWYGNPVIAADPLSTSGHTGLLDYDPAELVLTARSGTRLCVIEDALAERGQRLAFEPPRHATESTLGGAVATALSGPGRPFVGGVRDFVLGMRVIDGKGNVLKFGGQVMKNVAGYDVSRLMTGSLGILGLISEVYLKVLPVPPAQATLWFDWSEADAIRRVNEWSGKPFPLTASAWENGKLSIRLAGARAAVKSAVQHLGGAVMDARAAEAWWRSLRDQTHGFFRDPGQSGEAPSLWRLSLPTTAPVITELQIPGAARQLIEWGGAQRWLWSVAAPATMRQLARELGGHAVLFRMQKDDAEAFDSLSEPLMAIHRRLKQTFDPHGIFNPGRLYRGL